VLDNLGDDMGWQGRPLACQALNQCRDVCAAEATEGQCRHSWLSGKDPKRVSTDRCLNPNALVSSPVQVGSTLVSGNQPYYARPAASSQAIERLSKRD